MSLLQMITQASEAQAADVARLVAAYDRLVAENAALARAYAALRQDRDALVTCVMLLVQALDRRDQEPEVKEEINRACRLVGRTHTNGEER